MTTAPPSTTGPSAPGFRDPVDDARAARLSGAILAVSVPIFIIFMALHPSIHAHEPADFFAEVARTAPRNNLVHGVLIAASAALFLGFLGLADRLGPRRILVRAGLIAYALGVLAGAAAALTNGFIVPALASRHGADLADSFDRLRATLALCQVANSTFAQMDVLAQSAAVALWSLALLTRSTPARITGELGLLLSIAPAVALVAGYLPMDLHGFGAFILAQMIWTLMIAVQLMRNRI